MVIMEIETKDAKPISPKEGHDIEIETDLPSPRKSGKASPLDDPEPKELQRALEGYIKCQREQSEEARRRKTLAKLAIRKALREKAGKKGN